MDIRSRIAILGFGVEGRAVFEYLRDHKFTEITICDQNIDLEGDMPEGVSTQLGEHYLNDLDEFEVIFRSPGVRYLAPEVQAALAAGSEVTSSTAFFVDQCPCPIIGVTGTKGKGTTCSLIFEMLKKAAARAGCSTREDVRLAGNIGEPAISILDGLTAKSLAVLEMSSFQLQDLGKSPHYSVLLNTTSDHLDYHEDRGEYLEAKEHILVGQNEGSVAVLNKDYEYCEHYLPLVKGELLLVSAKGEVEDGAFVLGDGIYSVVGGDAKEVCSVDDVALIGSHNLENVLPAVAVCGRLGVSLKDMVAVIKGFKGLPHRLEFVRELNGVRYFNDSFSTTPETSMAAVDSFDEPTVLIAGGADKGLDYGEWATKILTRENLHTVILIGEIGDLLEKELIEAEEKLGEAEGSPTKIIRRSDLEEAVLEAFAEVPDGGVVVMSPGSSSLDMFESYKVRGEEFMEAVGKLR